MPVLPSQGAFLLPPTCLTQSKRADISDKGWLLSKKKAWMLIFNSNLCRPPQIHASHYLYRPQMPNYRPLSYTRHLLKEMYLTYLNPTLRVSSCVADLTETEEHKNVKVLIHFFKWKAVENFTKSFIQKHTEYQLGGYNEIRMTVWFLEFTIKWEETATSGVEMW